jgi:hypothetical protein
MRFEITRFVKKKTKKASHRHAPVDDRRGSGDRRAQSRRAHKRVVVGGKPADRRREPRRQDDRER